MKNQGEQAWEALAEALAASDERPKKKRSGVGRLAGLILLGVLFNVIVILFGGVVVGFAISSFTDLGFWDASAAGVSVWAATASLAAATRFFQGWGR